MKKEDVQRILIKLEVGTMTQYMLASGRDGYIARSGPVNVDVEHQPELLMGKAEEAVFQQLLSEFPDELFAYMGKRLELPEKAGRDCTVTVAVSDGTGESAFQIVYGSESDGPPQEVIDLIKKSIDISQPWFHVMVASLQSAKRRR